MGKYWKVSIYYGKQSFNRNGKINYILIERFWWLIVCYDLLWLWWWFIVTEGGWLQFMITDLYDDFNSDLYEILRLPDVP